jgi:hypothetical protein
LRSSALRLSDRHSSNCPAGSCFSPESAPRPLHDGVRRMGWNNLKSVLCDPGGARSRLCCDLTSSIVPHGTAFRPGAEARASLRLERSCQPGAIKPLEPPLSSGTLCRHATCDA